MISAETLRKCILRDAVMGKMSTQRPEDGNARDEVREAVLGEFTREEKEYPFEIPANWCWSRLGYLGKMQTGSTPPKNRPEYFGKDIPFIKPGDIYDDHINYDNEGLSWAGLKKGKLIHADSILMVCLSSVNSIGRCFYNTRDVSCNQQINAITPASCIDGKYLYFVMASPYFRHIARNKAHGTTIPLLNQSMWGKILVPVPPLKEQRRIVSRLEPILAIIDDLADHQKKLLNARRILRKCLLKEAIEGKLTKHFLEDGNARDIAREAVIGEFTNEEKLPFEIPSNWCWVRLGDIVTLNPRNHLPDDLPVSFLPMEKLEGGYGNIYTPSVRMWGDVRKGFTHFMNGDVIVAKITPCFQNRKSALVSGLTNGYGAGTTELHVMRAKECVERRYIFWLAKSEYFINTGANRMQGTAGQKRWRTCYFKNFLVPLPPLKEQQRIVQKLDAMLEVIDSMP